MLRISKLTDYATVVLAALARDPEQRISATQLAEKVRLEPPTVAKVLKTLARAELVNSVRGVNGGYQLAHSADDISVAEIVAAMEGPIALTECGLESGLCSHESDCSLRGNWQRIGEAVEGALSALSLADLSRPKPPRIAIRTETAAEPSRELS
jgi:FeS assembly SUF system regulator